MWAMHFRNSCFALLLWFLVASSAGCDPKICSNEARISLVVTVVNELGEPVTDATVTFAEGAAPAEPCGGEGDYVCGQEVDGDLTIRVEREGYEPFEDVVHVAYDGCHVVTEELFVELVPLS